MRVGIRLVAVLLISLSACSGKAAPTAPTAPTLDVQYWTTFDGAPLEYDVVPGADRGRRAPVVVLLHGFTGDARASMSDWSDELQSAGMTVVNADWFPASTDPPTPTADGALATLGAVACAIDHARSIGDEYGGDPGNVIVVGVSARHLGARGSAQECATGSARSRGPGAYCCFPWVLTSWTSSMPFRCSMH